MAHPGADYHVRVVADEPGVAEVVRGSGLRGERPPDVKAGSDRLEDVVDQERHLGREHPGAGVWFPLLEDVTVAVDHLQDDGGCVVDASTRKHCVGIEMLERHDLGCADRLSQPAIGGQVGVGKSHHPGCLEDPVIPELLEQEESGDVAGL